MDELIRLMEEALAQDLERCAAAIRADEKANALAALESAFSKLDMALDIARTQSATSFG